MKIELFAPLRFKKSNLTESDLNNYTDGINSSRYASKGRYSIIHILHSLNIYNGKVLISGYMCPSVEETLIKHGFSVGYFDIDLRDLNPSLDDIEKCLNEDHCVAVIAPSLYGNPADLEAIYEICKRHNTCMIDDAAQSCGALLNGKRIGGFGDGGFISFSPGKPTSGHMGSFFWSNLSNSYNVNRSHHCLFHYVSYLEYLFTRYYIYKTPKFLQKFIYMTCRFVDGRVNLINDDICEFEKRILGGIILQNEENVVSRNLMLNYIVSEISNIQPDFRIIRNVRGRPNNSKLVLLFDNKENATRFKSLLTARKIAFYGGYKIPITKSNLNNCRIIDGCIVELPLEMNEKRMNYMIKVINEYIKDNNYDKCN